MDEDLPGARVPRHVGAAAPHVATGTLDSLVEYEAGTTFDDMDALGGALPEDARPTQPAEAAAAAAAADDAEFSFDSLIDPPDTQQVQQPEHAVADTAAKQDSVAPVLSAPETAAALPEAATQHKEFPQNAHHILAADGDDVLPKTSTDTIKGLDSGPMFGEDAVPLANKDPRLVDSKDASVVDTTKDAAPDAVVDAVPVAVADPAPHLKPQTLPSSDLQPGGQPLVEQIQAGGSNFGTSDSIYEEPALRHANRHKPSWQQHAHGYVPKIAAAAAVCVFFVTT